MNTVLVAYMNVKALTAVLRKCGDELTPENLIRQATSLHGTRMPLMPPGVFISTAPGDYTPFKILRAPALWLARPAGLRGKARRHATA